MKKDEYSFLELFGNIDDEYTKKEPWSYVKKKYKLNTTNFLFLCNC